MNFKQEKKIILGACLENCVHVAGVLNFMQIAEEFGFEAELLGFAVAKQQMRKTVLTCRKGGPIRGPGRREIFW